MLVRIILVTLGVITATPAAALFAPGSLTTAYGMAVPSDPMALSLLQHRGMLQAALGAALVWAAFQPLARIPVAATAIATKATFLVLLGPDRLGDVLGVPFDLLAIVLLAFVIRHQLVASRA
ncbi:hypothetical protein ACIBEJ_06280 [Nonomuraea sp. NPDC050790]|uniref:hypothetical protein n=1 Tax=Nonomuraea sp. NPDC050790 TaxID=3364371 RepID=UPI0037B7EDED